MTSHVVDADQRKPTAPVPMRPEAAWHRRASLFSWVYLVPALVVFAVFVFYPLVRSFVISFQGTNIIGEPKGFVGMKNYAQLFHDPTFARILWQTFLFVVITVIPVIVIALILAMVLHGKIRGARFFRTVYAAPFAFSVAASSVIFSVLFNQATGVLNGLLSVFGIDRVGWLTNPRVALVSIAITTVWMQMGYNLLVLAAGLGALPDDILEAARLDGASGFRLNTSIVLPLLTPQIFFLVVTGTINSLESFGQVNILTLGGPNNSTTTLVYSIYQQAFANGNAHFGYASAQAVVLFFVVLIITAIQFGVLQRKVFYR